MYRIGVIDDIRGTTSVIQMKQFGEMKVFDAWQITSNDVGEEIHVFLNFKKLAQFRSRSSAKNKIMELVNKAPDIFFREQVEYLL